MTLHKTAVDAAKLDASLSSGKSARVSLQSATQDALDNEVPAEMFKRLSLNRLFDAFDESEAQKIADRARNDVASRSVIDRHMDAYSSGEGMNGLKRIELCRRALDALDRRGWERSFHQRQFHEEYLKSCARIFFKRDGPGAFNRAHARVLEVNGWDSTPQEILVSTPRRFGKTISVSLFAAAMIFSCPNMELSIYSTCKRISQKLLRNVARFLELIYLELQVQPYTVLRQNQEEVHVQGNEGHGDLRVINSYPSKIGNRRPHDKNNIYYYYYDKIRGRSRTNKAVACVFHRVRRRSDKKRAWCVACRVRARYVRQIGPAIRRGAPHGDPRRRGP